MMKNTNHLSIDRPLKKHLNTILKEFRKYRFSEPDTVPSKRKKKKVLFDILFDEYDTVGDLMKSFF
ncbi:hypothetical protein P8625_03040 [Tenacibaculum tangerinum]|uniref:Uncharacterized protein n=1 Tax=Tenacibaculum tangerinum TaxID=3038772 RepID=A0ABY8L708_9FLAO|nr:hypothetical protein [Tenacibaculum tangerinum]WGH76158.1 hypothetical protein P8625_03040 [Tenacibaculum tangerinum]